MRRDRRSVWNDRGEGHGACESIKGLTPICLDLLAQVGSFITVAKVSQRDINAMASKQACGDRAETKESAAVRAAFEAYRKALLARNGEAASALVDRETIEHFGRGMEPDRRDAAGRARDRLR